jgi:hypothetical protein
VKQKSPDVRLALGVFREQMLSNIRAGAKAPHINLDLKKDARISEGPPTKEEFDLDDDSLLSD